VRIAIYSESGTWIILRCTEHITDKMTDTELLRYIFRTVEQMCPEESRPQKVTVRLEVTE